MEKIPLKAFWEAVEQRLAACSADELRAILRAMAQETPPSERQTFLDKLKPVEETTITAQQVMQQEDLLADIEDLIHELKVAMEGAEYWEERYGWGEYDEEDSLGPYEEFVPPLVELFDRTEAAFDYGNLPLARTAYQKLFEVLRLEDDYGRGVSASDISTSSMHRLTGVDMGEAYARYLRAVYETEAPARRPQALFEQLQQTHQAYLAHPPSRQVEIGWGGDDLERPAWITRSVLAHACLLAEDFDAAHQLVARENVLGWSHSDNPQGLVVSFFLGLLSGQSFSALPSNLTQLWQWGLQNSIDFWVGGDEKEDSISKRLERAYAELFANASLSREKQAELLAWCLDVAQQRVNAIVSNQHRKSYGKAAVVITACAEVLRLREDAKEAGSLLNDVRNRFPRHRAFQAELKAAVQRMEHSR